MKKQLDFQLALRAAVGALFLIVPQGASNVQANESWAFSTTVESTALVKTIDIASIARTETSDVVVLTQFNILQQAAKRTFGRSRSVSPENRSRDSRLGSDSAIESLKNPKRPEVAPVAAPIAAPIAQEAVPQEPAVSSLDEATGKVPTGTVEISSADAANAPEEENFVETAAPQNEEAVALENQKREAAANAQTAENSAEDKTRALATGDSDAPDARVDLPKVDPSATKPEPIDDQPAPKPSLAVKPGYGEAQKAVQEMTNDLLSTLNSRGGTALYNRWRAYNAGVRRQTSALESGSELNGRCRLRWYEKLYQDPLHSVGEAEYYSQAWGGFFMGTSNDVVSGVRLAREKTDVPTRGDRPVRKTSTTPAEALQSLSSAIVDAAALHAKALAPMTKDDVAAVSKEAHSIFCGQVQSGHTVPSRGRAKYLIDAMQKMNKSALYDSAETILTALDPETVELLAKLELDSLEKVVVDGQEVRRVATEAGDIIIGGTENNVWNLDKFSNICCVVDLGGNDVYKEGACNVNRPILVVLDLGEGDDEYVGQNPGIQGSAILGVSVWYDGGGNDKYLAKDLAQGSAIGGIGVLINENGNDRYLGFLRTQGTALCGLGLLIDRGGSDDYRGALFAQGFGAPGGFGALVDRNGDDHYYVGGYYFDSYPEHPGYDGWGQGVGAGIRRVACGGIGLLLDGGGDDAYEYDYFGHGGGYWMGVGIARDFGGNDVRYAATSTMYDGSRRREARWQRFGTGFGCHYAVGYLFDDGGNDSYNGTIMGVGMGWDLGAGFLVDFGGNDVFEATGGLTQGAGGEGSIGCIMNYRGDDIYRGNYQGYATNYLTYHAQQDCGANYSFVIDEGGFDQYGSRAQNNAVTTRGATTGFIVDRPAPGESTAPKQNAQAGQNGQNASTNPAAQRPATSQGYPTNEGAIKTMVGAPPTVDSTPMQQPSGGNPGGGFGGFGGRGPWRLFGGGM